MKIDLVYPKIPENSDKFHDKCIAFEKYDGTNLHWCWSVQEGWHKFGTRRTQFPFTRNGIADFAKEHPELAPAPHLFNERLRDRLTVLFARGNDWYRKFTLFTEFYGPNSFAGGHSDEDARNDSQELILIDLSCDKKILPPEEFLKVFKLIPGDIEFPTAQVIYTGKYSGQFAEDVRKGKYNVNEGVVVKGIVDGEVFMTKVKTKDYLKRLEKR